jgi:hypothetical protein
VKRHVPPSQRKDPETRHLVIDGRKWRRSDPSIPEPLRVQLVAELMDARRAVAAALRAEDARAERAARARVKDAKHALGERGAPWWEPMDDTQLATRAVACARALLRHRGTEKTICPSEVARTVGGDRWRTELKRVRAALAGQVPEGTLEFRQKGKVVAPERARAGAHRVRPCALRLRTQPCSSRIVGAARDRAE